MAMSPRKASFPELVAQLDYAMFIVTTAAGEERAGCLIGFASQVSIHRTFRIGQRADVLVVHFVPEGADELAELFGGETGDDVDKFARVQWRPGPDGVPILSDLENWFAGRIIERIDFGDHWGFLLEPIEGQAGQADSKLTFHRAKRIEPGHEP
jgi:flavin reductase (DIM6/NTAB) family NADH-FMN oxidoreductase RutF